MKARIARLQKACRKRGLDAMYVRDTSNIAWLTAFEGVFDDERAHAAFVPARGKKAFLHTDARYALAARGQRRGSGFKVDEQPADRAAWAAQRASGLEVKRPCIGIEDSMTLAEHRALISHLKPKALRETHDTVLKLRAVKDEAELARIREAQAITDAAFERIVGLMAPGMTERAVQRALDDALFDLGADALAFPTIVACGENGASPHAQPGDAVLQAGMCVVMDFGAKKGGYCSDMTRTVFLGQPFGEMLHAWEALRAANEAAEAMLAPGVTGKQAHEEAERVLASYGFGGCMGHALGHGVGLDIHELPVLSPRNDKPLRPGNIVTVEPGIYLPGKFGMRLEDMGIVTEDGFEVLTATPHDMVVI